MAAAPMPFARASSRAPAVLAALMPLLAAGAFGLWWLTRPPVPAATRSAAPTVLESPAAARREPPAPARVDAATLQRLKAAVIEANRAHTQAVFGSDPREAQLRQALESAIGELGQALYRARVTEAGGDADQARADMRSFLESLDEGGLGLSAEAVDAGVARVAP